MALSQNILMLLMTASVSLVSVTGQEDPRLEANSGEDKGSHNNKDSNCKKGIIAGMGSVIAILILVIVLILVRYKYPRIREYCAAGVSPEQSTNAEQNNEGNHADHDFEELQMQNQQAGLGDVVPYASADVKPPSDHHQYATVNFQKHSVSVSTDGNALPDMNKNCSSACDYSSVSSTQGATHCPAPEQHLYSTITVPEGP